MSEVLLTDQNIVELRKLAMMGMQTPITIKRMSVVDTSSTPSTDYGDDEVAYSETTESRISTLKGWFFSVPQTVIETDTGQVVSSNVYRVFLPVGTNIAAGDEVVVGSETYKVIDTNQEATWLPLLRCNLRKRE